MFDPGCSIHCFGPNNRKETDVVLFIKMVREEPLTFLKHLRNCQVIAPYIIANVFFSNHEHATMNGSLPALGQNALNYLPPYRSKFDYPFFSTRPSLLYSRVIETDATTQIFPLDLMVIICTVCSITNVAETRVMISRFVPGSGSF